MPINVNTVGTNKHLEDLIGGSDKMTALVDGADDAQAARQWALDEIVEELGGFTPPIREADLVDVTELRSAMLNGAASKLYLDNITTGGPDDSRASLHKIFEKRFRSKLRSLRPTVTGNKVAAPTAIAFHRR